MLIIVSCRRGLFVVSSGANVTVLSSVEDVEFILKGRTETGSFKYTGTTDFKLTWTVCRLSILWGSVINVQTPVRTFVAASEATQNCFDRRYGIRVFQGGR